METGGGRFFDFAGPTVESIDLWDIARSLAHTCRFGGHVRRFYSVAEHSLLVRDLVVEAGHPRLALAALHHDSHEAYVGDLPTPLKNAIGDGYRPMVDAIDGAIAGWLGIDPGWFHHPAIKQADTLALRMEAAALKDSQGIVGDWPWRELPPMNERWTPGLHPDVARERFLAEHHRELERIG